MKSKISSDEKERKALFQRQIELTARIERNRKILKLVEERAAKKFKCLVNKIEAEGKDLSATIIDTEAFADLRPLSLPDPSSIPLLAPGS